MQVSDTLISQTISNLRFPLMVGVVAIHLGMSNTGFPAADIISKLFSGLIPSSCVPLFFLISGFLFFWKVKDFSLKTYGKKIKNRLRTLVIPYLIWNTFMIICYAAVHFFAPTLTSVENENVLQYSLADWITAYWNKSGGQPVSFQLWFLRNLIVMSFFSPIFFLLSRLPSVLRLMPLPIFVALESRAGYGWCCGVFYFYLGVLLSEYNTTLRIKGMFGKFIEKRELWGILILIWIALVALCLNNDNSAFLDMTLRFFGGACVLFSAMFFTAKLGKVNEFVENSGYFVYLFHAFPSFVFKKFSEMFIHPSTSSACIIIYFARIVAMIGISLVFYLMLLKWFPRFTAVITGRKVLIR